MCMSPSALCSHCTFSSSSCPPLPALQCPDTLGMLCLLWALAWQKPPRSGVMCDGAKGSLLFQLCQKRFCLHNPGDCSSPSKPLGAVLGALPKPCLAPRPCLPCTHPAGTRAWPGLAAWARLPGKRCRSPSLLRVSLTHPLLQAQELGCLLSTSEGHHSQADAEIQRFSLSVTILMLHDLQSPARPLFWQQSICFRPVWVV